MSRWLLVLGVLGSLLIASVCQAGNKEMIEQRVQELDDLNKQAVGQIKELPSHGQVDLKAHILLQGGTPNIEILEKKVTETATIKHEPIDFKAGNVAPPPAGEATSKERPDEQRPN